MIYNSLYDWQKKLVDSIMSNRCFGLFLDMGLGKTPISLALAERHSCTKVIVITINAKVVESQYDEGSWLYWAGKSDMKYQFSVKKETHFDEEHSDILLINYESLYIRNKTKKKSSVTLSKPVVDFIASCKNKNVAIIVDESHKMKDLTSKQTKAINLLKAKLEAKARVVFTYLLTGTPFTTGYIDLYSQLKTLGYNETKSNFVDDFCVRGNVPGLLGWQQPIVGYKNIEQLFKLVHRYAITVETNTVVKLPEQIFVEHTLPMSDDFYMFMSEKVPEQKLLSYSIQQNAPEEITSMFSKSIVKRNNFFYRDIGVLAGSPWLAETSGAFWLRARQLSIGFNGNAEMSQWYDKRRLEQLKIFLENNPDNYVLFYNYTPELLEIFDICTELDYNIDVYCGEVKSLMYYERYARQTNEQKLTNTKNIIIANFASGSTGMNWQQYNKCIIFSLPLYKDFSQGIKRIHRTGQTKPVFYHIFYQNNWLDKGMYSALKEQRDYNEQMFEADLARVNELI